MVLSLPANLVDANGATVITHNPVTVTLSNGQTITIAANASSDRKPDDVIALVLERLVAQDAKFIPVATLIALRDVFQDQGDRRASGLKHRRYERDGKRSLPLVLAGLASAVCSSPRNAERNRVAGSLIAQAGEEIVDTASCARILRQACPRLAGIDADTSITSRR